MSQVVVGRFDLCDLVDVFHAYGPDPVLARLRGTLFDTCRLFQEVCDGRCLRHKCECTVGLDGDEGWYRYSRLDVGGTCVEFLAKVHGLDAPCAERRSNRRARRRLASSNEDAYNLRARSERLRHRRR